MSEQMMILYLEAVEKYLLFNSRGKLWTLGLN